MNSENTNNRSNENISLEQILNKYDSADILSRAIMNSAKKNGNINRVPLKSLMSPFLKNILAHDSESESESESEVDDNNDSKSKTKTIVQHLFNDDDEPTISKQENLNYKFEDYDYGDNNSVESLENDEICDNNSIETEIENLENEIKSLEYSDDIAHDYVDDVKEVNDHNQIVETESIQTNDSEDEMNITINSTGTRHEINEQILNAVESQILEIINTGTFEQVCSSHFKII